MADAERNPFGAGILSSGLHSVRSMREKRLLVVEAVAFNHISLPRAFRRTLTVSPDEHYPPPGPVGASLAEHPLTPVACRLGLSEIDETGQYGGTRRLVHLAAADAQGGGARWASDQHFVRWLWQRL